MFDKYKTKGAYHYAWYTQQDPAWYRKCVDKCVEFCKGSTLDVGCGDGLLTDLIAQNYEVTGIDYEEYAITLAKAHATRGRYIVHNLEDPIDGEWEYMVCLNVIEHLDKPGSILRILRENITKAAIIITDIPQEHPSSHHVKEYSPRELADMFSDYRTVPFQIDKDFHGIEVYK